VARLDPLPVEKLSPEQKALHDMLASSRNGRVTGPFAIWLRTPAVCDAANKLTLSLRENGNVNKRLYELITLIVTRYWSAQYAWSQHERAAAAAGISQDVIDAIRDRRKPDLKTDDERLVYEAVTELLERKPLSQATHDRMLKQFGVEHTIEIVSIVGLYSLVSTVLNTFDVPTLNGETPF
jgi:4-carboxymuconolactone decarboxylase